MASITAIGDSIELPKGRAPSSFRLLPAGRFKARDGRPNGLAHGWNLTDDLARKLIDAATRQNDRFLIDYDHQTLNAPANGGKAPAAGWFSRLEWRPGDGLYALGVEWTASALAAIRAREYRYISPVLTYDATTGDVTGLLMAAIVNYPALDGLTDLAVAASARFGSTTAPTLNATEIYARRRPA
jgi:phage I-like protein